MKKIIILITFIGLVLASCSESFLDTDSLTSKVDNNYYQNSADVNSALAGAYAVIGSIPTSQLNFLVCELMSDDRFGGGGMNDQSFHATSKFRRVGEDDYIGAWQNYYQGIYRVNQLIKHIGNVKWKNDLEKGTGIGEAHFLRAYFYFDMARLWGNVPLDTVTDNVNLPKASADDLFASIATDLKIAIDNFPATKYDKSGANLGHATKWAAEGLMARVFLFYTGFYDKTTLPLIGGGSISKSDVITWVDDCVAYSGHALIPDFKNLWPYAIANNSYKDYEYAVNNNLKWIDETGANTETVFAIKFSALGSWSTSHYYAQGLNLYFGIRNQQLCPFGQGWGGGPVNSQLWDSWDNNDIRKKASIMNFRDTTGEGVAGYNYGGDKMYHETGYWQKKYMPIWIHYISKTDGSKQLGSYAISMYGAPNDMQLSNTQDIVVIRFADILLMGAELGSANAQNYMDQVRRRAGYADGSATPTLANIKQERRHELAFEFTRYYDLMRWHDVDAAMAAVTNIPVMNNKTGTSFSPNATYSKDYRPETKGFLPIPNSQVLLSNGTLTQNPGWGPESLMTEQ